MVMTAQRASTGAVVRSSLTVPTSPLPALLPPAPEPSPHAINPTANNAIVRTLLIGFIGNLLGADNQLGSDDRQVTN
jgi:hypothetical protein